MAEQNQGKPGSRASELLAALEAGKSFDELGPLYQRPEPSRGELELRRRAALVSTFDPELYEEVLGRDLPDGVEPPDFDEFVKSPEFERVPRARRTYRMKRMAQAPLFATWKLEERQRFSARLAAFYGTPPVDDLEQLSHEIVASPDTACPRFEALYDQADAAVDLPRCDRLLRIVEARADEHPLSVTFDEILADRTQLFAARNQFADEYSRSASFYGRDVERRQFRDFLDDRDHYIFHLFGPGGYGKTMLLRQIVARELIPRPLRLPVARVDFDLIRLAALDAHAWLVLVPIAEQLQAQGVFKTQLTGLLSDVQDVAPYLRRPLANENTDYLTDLDKRLANDSKNLEVKTVSTLSFAFNTLAKPVVIVLDTVEELSVHRQTSLIKLLDCLALVHESCPSLRVVLSGRHNLMDPKRAPAFQRFAAVTVTAPLAAFTEAEGIGYLKESRGLEERHPLRAMFRKSGGNPFNLALLADLAASRESLTEEDVNRYPHADLAYLVDRILDRIPKEDDPLPWILRYGVVPRDLTKSFLREVIEPMLPIVSKKESTLDRANEQLFEGAAPNRRGQVWEPAGAPQTDKRWNTLTKYASAQSWVDMPTGDKELVHFQPELVKPMRRLLAKAEIFPILQERAAEYFEALAERDRARWSHWMAQAIYHRFELEGPYAIHRWRKLVLAAEFGFEARHDLARILLDNAFRDDDTDVVWWKDGRTPLVNGMARAEAHFELAALAAQEGVRLPDTSQAQRDAWARAKEHIDAAGFHNWDECDGMLVADCLNTKYERWALVNGAILLADGGYEKAVAFLDAAFAKVTAPQYLVAFDLQIASALAALDDPRCVTHLIRARDRAYAMNAPHDVSLAAISRKIGQWYEDHDDDGKAILAYQDARLALTETSDPSDAQHIIASLGELLRVSTMLEASGRVYEDSLTLSQVQQDPVARGTIRCSLARTHLDRGEPFLALEALNDPLPEPAPPAMVLAARQQMRGTIEMELLEFDRARTALNAAADLWREAKFERLASEVRTLQFKLWFDKAGDLHQAGGYTDTRETTAASADSHLDVKTGLDAIRWFMAMGNRPAAVRRWSELVAHDGVARSRRLMCMTLAAGLAFGLDRGESDLRDYLERLMTITPPAGRFGFLRFFRFAGTGTVRASMALSSRLRACVNLEDAHEPDQPLRALIACDAYRAFGMTEQASVLLRSAIEALREGGRWLFLQEAARVQDRLGDSRGLDDEDVDGFVQEFGNYPTLCAALHLEQGERAWRRGDAGEMANCIDKSALLLSRATNTHWSARWFALSARAARINKRPSEAVPAALQSAVATYLSLGDRIHASALEESLSEPIVRSVDYDAGRSARESAAAVPSAVPAFSADEAHRISITSEGRDRVLVTIRFKDGPEFDSEHSVAPENDSFVRLLTSDLLEYNFQAVERMARDPDTFAARLGGLLFSTSLQGQFGPSPGPVQLQISKELQAVPWELASFGGRPLTHAWWVTAVTREQPPAALQSDTVRWVQDALSAVSPVGIKVDGLLGPVTLDALRRYKQNVGLASPDDLDAETIRALRSRRAAREPLSQTVAVLKGSGADERKRRWGYGTVSTNLLQLYGETGTERLRAATMMSPVPAIAKLGEDLAASAPDVVHIFSGFQETTTRSGSAVFLDFGEESAQGLTAAEFARLLRPLSVDRIRPVIVLESAHVDDPLEAVRQLFLRNIFASQLYAMGVARAVLATGLIERPHLARFGPLLVSSLLDAPHLTDLARMLCAFEAKFAPATVLFATDPRLPALG